MCIKIVEIYKICRCVYYTHAVDPCPAYGHRGHCVMTKNVLVGYTCSRHSINLISEEFIDDAGDPTTRPEDSRARNVFAKHQDGLERSTEEGTIDTSLRGRLLARVQKVLETDEQFIPAGDLDGVLTGLTIKRELQNQGLGDVSDHVFRHAKRIFAILLVIQKLDTLKILIEEGLGDEVLPIAVSVNGLPKDKKLQSAFSEWDLDTTKQFADFQWTVLAPVFSEGMHLKLHDDARLPFLRTKRIANGAYGGVHRVEIHCNHLNFMKFESPISTEGHIFALKQFTRGTADVNQRAFNRELDIMRSIRSSGHSHIIKLLATFEHRGRYSMILPLAEENLRQFWARAKPSSIPAHWYFEQIAGIATALSYIHNDLVTPDSRPVSGFHMDLKPENILIEKDDPATHSTWKISDFGCSRMKPRDSSLKLPPHPGLGTYEPPECQLDLPQSQAYDIWSLGCVFLECVVWLMNGSGAIEAFAEDRLKDAELSGNMFKDDYFFTLEFNRSLKPFRAITRPAVIKCIQDLDSDPNCSEATFRLLHLIRDGLLQVDQSRRLKANYLSQRLELIHNTAKGLLEPDPQSTSQSTSDAQVTKIAD